MADFTIKQSDLREDLERQLTSGGSVVDLSSAASVEFHLCSKPERDNLVFNKDAKVTDAANGEVEYRWDESDTDREAGTYYFEFQVNWDNGDPQTFPNDGFKVIKITAEGA